MILIFRTIFTNLLDSFHNDKGGYSFRKLFAFNCVMISIYLSVKHTDQSNAVEMVTIYLVTALLAAGMVTVQQIIDFKAGKKSDQ